MMSLIMRYVVRCIYFIEDTAISLKGKQQTFILLKSISVFKNTFFYII